MIGMCSMIGSSTLDEIRSGLQCNFNVTMLMTNNLLHVFKYNQSKNNIWQCFDLKVKKF
jgi:hypothetical protein